MASYLEKIMREPKNPYLPADGSLAALRAADMAGYRPNEAILPNMNPMLGYTSRRMDGYRPNTLDSSVPKGRQPDKDYSGYGKSLEEALPYGYEFGDADKAVVGVGFDNPNAARIEQLRGEIASLEKQIKDYDVEADMGRYKFQYDADPSTYVGGQQSRRNAEETRRIREANEKATERSQDQSALKELGTGMFTAYYAIRNAENNLKQAIESGDPVAIRNAKTDLSREKVTYKKQKGQYDELAARIMKDLGVEPVDYGEEAALDLDNDVDVKAAQEYQDLKGKIMTATDELRQRPEIMDKTEKAFIIKNAKKTLDEFRQSYAGLDGLNPTLKAELEKTINAYEDAITTFKKKQGTKITADEFAALTGPDLLKYSLKELESFKKRGFKNYGLDDAITVKKSGK